MLPKRLWKPAMPGAITALQNCIQLLCPLCTKLAAPHLIHARELRRHVLSDNAFACAEVRGTDPGLDLGKQLKGIKESEAVTLQHVQPLHKLLAKINDGSQLQMRLQPFAAPQLAARGIAEELGDARPRCSAQVVRLQRCHPG